MERYVLVDSLQKQEVPEERDERGRFLKGVSGNPEGRFKPGLSGNPAGRRPGSRNKATETAELLLEGEAEALTRKAVEKALAGNPMALRLCLDRLIPPRRGRKVQLANVPPGRQRRRARPDYGGDDTFPRRRKTFARTRTARAAIDETLKNQDFRKGAAGTQ